MIDFDIRYQQEICLYFRTFNLSNFYQEFINVNNM